MKKLTCSVCGDKVEYEKVNKLIEKKTKKAVDEDDELEHFLGVVEVDEAIKSGQGDAHYYCPHCGTKFYIKDTKEFKEANPHYKDKVF